jgi:hypothetical protein
MYSAIMPTGYDLFPEGVIVEPFSIRGAEDCVHTVLCSCERIERR